MMFLSALLFVVPSMTPSHADEPITVTVTPETSEISDSDSSTICEVRILMLGTKAGVEIPESVPDPQQFQKTLSEAGSIAWTRQLRTPVLMGQEMMWNSGETTPVVTGQVMTPRSQQPVRSLTQVQTGTIIKIEELSMEEEWIVMKLDVESSRLEKLPEYNSEAPDRELMTQIQQTSYKGRIAVQNGKTVMVQGSQSSSSEDAPSGNILIFVTARRM
ncbi:MAG: hypothetical protein JNL58_22325 [Planctomyces sp.]|nr:hypothetical protein [Planctomyces sp.]